MNSLHVIDPESGGLELTSDARKLDDKGFNIPRERVFPPSIS